MLNEKSLLGPSVPDGYTKLSLVREFDLVRKILLLRDGFLDLIYHRYVGDKRMFLPVPFLALLVLEVFKGRACPSLVPRKKDLKKLLDGPSRNFWYGIEENKYLEASVLGSDVVTIKNFVGATGTLHDSSLKPHI